MNTDVPGLERQHILQTYRRSPVVFVRGEGCSLWDADGTRYLDLVSGVGVAALGHANPRLAAAVADQATTLLHTSNLYFHPLQGQVAARLAALSGLPRAFFCNSGTEANEGLLKLARLHGMKKAGGEEGKCFHVICAERAFHGRTFGGMSATPQEKIQKGFRPLVPGFSFGELNRLETFEALVTEQTAAIFLETIQGEGGVHACTPEFLRGVRQLCDRHNLLLMLDEVQCGVGRTGAFFAFEHLGIRPDAIGMAKGLGGGFPMGAIWIGERGADLFHPGSHGSTFGGTPLACAAGLAVLDVIEQEHLLEKVRLNSVSWIADLKAIAGDFPSQISGVRGYGFLVGLQLTSDPAPLVTSLREAGLLVPSAGGNVIRLLPPLTATPQELAESVQILRTVLKAKS